MGTRNSEAHELVASRLGETGQFYTKGRRELVELLISAGRPSSIPELLDLRPRLTQSSLYRNMTDLESVGIIQRVAGTDDLSRYELSEDILGHHHHTICTECGAVDDFVVPTRAERSLESALDKALGDIGFRPSTHRLDVLGTCAACA
jgi:Fe2+ or Zn2+ uptake regulation protein